jgi:hypothetical protein
MEALAEYIRIDSLLYGTGEVRERPGRWTKKTSAATDRSLELVRLFRDDPEARAAFDRWWQS